MDVGMIFKIAGIGIVVAAKSGAKKLREEMATMVTLTGIVVLMMVIEMI